MAMLSNFGPVEALLLAVVVKVADILLLDGGGFY